MKQRIITGVIFGLITIGLLIFNDMSRTVFVLLVPLLAGYEYAKITKFTFIDTLISFLLIGGLVLVYIYIPKIHLSLLAICIFILVLLLVNLFKDPPFIKHERLRSIILPFYIFLPFIAYYFGGVHLQNSYFLLHLIILIWISDSAAYFVGSQVGKRKLFPRISPKKTWEGLWGAALMTLIASYIIFSITKTETLSYWALFAILAWSISSSGDLIASHVKRIHKVKDSGTILPGHGGFFDRFDGYIYALPFLLLFDQLFN